MRPLAAVLLSALVAGAGGGSAWLAARGEVHRAAAGPTLPTGGAVVRHAPPQLTAPEPREDAVSSLARTTHLASLHVLLLDDLDRPVHPVRLRVGSADRSRSLVAGPDGARCELPAGACELRVEEWPEGHLLLRPGGRPATRSLRVPLELEPAEEARVVLRLPRAARLSVAWHGSDAPGALVLEHLAGPPGCRSLTLTEGRAEADGLLPGEVLLAPQGAPLRSRRLRLVAGATVQLDLSADASAPARLAGRVVDADGAPLAGHRLRARRTDLDADAWLARGRPMPLGPDGRFDGLELPPGGYRLEVSDGAGRTDTWTELDAYLELGPGQALDLTDLVAPTPEAYRLVGQVSAGPAARVELWIPGATRGERLGLDGEGRFAWSSTAPPGRLELRLHRGRELLDVRELRPGPGALEHVVLGR